MNTDRKLYFTLAFWDDEYILTLPPLEKLLFKYCFQNPHINYSGIYKIAMAKIVFHTGLKEDYIAKILAKFEKEKKIAYTDGWMCVKNLPKHHNTKSPKIQENIKKNMSTVPDNIKKTFKNKGVLPMEIPYG